MGLLMNSSHRPNRPRHLNRFDLLAIVLAVFGLRMMSDYLVDQLLAHFSR